MTQRWSNESSEKFVKFNINETLEGTLWKFSLSVVSSLNKKMLFKLCLPILGAVNKFMKAGSKTLK